MAADSPDEIEEERRLLYVAMTRAKDDLHLLVPQRFYTHQQPRHGDRHVYAARSRFIPSILLDLFESPSRAAFSTPATHAARADAAMDAGARLREMWR
jgi:DNA helicase-2/ATP-dependent DNA helicase PcrA